MINRSTTGFGFWGSPIWTQTNVEATACAVSCFSLRKRSSLTPKSSTPAQWLALPKETITHWQESHGITHDFPGFSLCWPEIMEWHETMTSASCQHWRSACDCPSISGTALPANPMIPLVKRSIESSSQATESLSHHQSIYQWPNGWFSLMIYKKYPLIILPLVAR